MGKTTGNAVKEPKLKWLLFLPLKAGIIPSDLGRFARRCAATANHGDITSAAQTAGANRFLAFAAEVIMIDAGHVKVHPHGDGSMEQIVVDADRRIVEKWQDKGKYSG